jgi:hypothetical protein
MDNFSSLTINLNTVRIINPPIPIDDVAIENCDENTANPRNTYIRISVYLLIFCLIAVIV